MKNKLISNTILVIGSSMLVNIVNYFYHLVFGRFLGPVDYGILASLYSLLYIVSIVPQSTSYAVVKFVSSAQSISEKRQIYNSIYSYGFKMSIVLSIAVLILSPHISKFMNIGNVWLVAIVSPILFLVITTLINQATFQGLMEFKGLVIPNVISSMGKFVVGIGLVFLGYRVMGAMIGVLLGGLAAFVYAYFNIKKFRHGNSKGNFSIKTFIKYSFPVLIQSLAFTSIFTADLILAKHFLNPHEAGIYASLSMLGKIIFFAVSPIVSVLFPEVSKRQSKGTKFNKVILGSLFVAISICIGATMVYYLFPGLVVGLLYGKLFLEAKDGLFLMGLFMSFYTISYMIVNFFLSLGTTWVAYISLFAAISQIVGIYFFNQSINMIINVSLYINAAMTLILTITLAYNLRYAKE